MIETVEVKVRISPKAWWALTKLAQRKKCTVGDLVWELARRQLAGVEPLAAEEWSRTFKPPRVKRVTVSSRRSPRGWSELEDRRIRELNGRGWSDARIARDLERNQPAVSRRRQELGLPSLFRSPNPKAVAS